MKKYLFYSKTIKTPIGYFIIGYSLKSFAMGIRIDKWGIAIDAFPLWFAWEK